jgi:outer membrane protein, multidrug efflux system
MNKTHLTHTLLSALMLGGCTIGPDYLPPEINTPETFLHNDANQTTQQSIDKKWWENFKDESLNRAIEEAYLSNFDLQSSRASVDALLGQFDQAASYLYPQINANGSLNRKGVDNASMGSFQLREGITSTYAASLSLASYEIDLFGKVRRANESARAALLSSEYAVDSLKLSVASSVAASYIKLSSLHEQINLAKKNIEVSDQIVKFNEMKYKHGVIAETTVLQSLSELQNAKGTLSQLEAAKIGEESTFNLLLGRNPSVVNTTPLDKITLPGVPSALPSILLVQRPDIAMAEQNLIAANARIGVARAAYFPSIKLTGMFGVQSLELNRFISNPARLWEIAPSISLPLFSAGRIAGEIKTAEADRNQTLALYKKSIINAFNDADNAIGQTTKASEQLTYQRARSDAIHKGLEQSILRFQIGAISYSDMLLVQQQWFQASQQYKIAQQNALIATLSLYKALGGGWSKDQTPPHPNLLPSRQ